MVYSNELPALAHCVVGEPGSPKRARLDYIRHLHFHVRLQPYGIEEFDSEEPRETVSRDNNLFADSISDLFSVLANWRGNKPNLVLELSAGSSGDALHRLSAFHMSDDYPYEIAEDVDPGFRIFTSFLMLGDFLPLDELGSILSFTPTYRMAGLSRDGSGKVGRQPHWDNIHSRDTPPLPIVRGLVISLRFYRVISHKFLSNLILTKLPGLKDIRLEQ